MIWAIREDYLSVIGSDARIRINVMRNTASTQRILTTLFLKRNCNILTNGMYYEITFDGDKDCAYVDAYKKWQNVKMDGCKLRGAIC